jgi:hypothetical protein
LSIPALPFAWYAQFKLEQRFGFNTTSMKTWVIDRIKGLLLALLLGYPLLVLVLKLIEWTGANWWLWAAESSCSTRWSRNSLSRNWNPCSRMKLGIIKSDMY